MGAAVQPPESLPIPALQSGVQLVPEAVPIPIPIPESPCTDLYLEESIWSLGGETWFVLTAQNSVWQRELDFRILQGKHLC